MKTWRLLLFVGTFLAVIPLSYGQEKRWSDEAELSLVDTGGNTDVTTLSAKNALKYRFTEKLEGLWEIAALYGKSDGQRNAEHYATALRLDYLLTSQIYVYGAGGWSKDQFSGLDSRITVGPGVGYKFLTGPKHLLSGETGLNYVNEEYTNGTENDFVNGRLFGKYEYHFTNKNKFNQSVEFLYDFDDSENYNINSETAVICALNDRFALKTSYTVKFDNRPVPSTLDDTDTILSASLVVNF